MEVVDGTSLLKVVYSLLATVQNSMIPWCCYLLQSYILNGNTVGSVYSYRVVYNRNTVLKLRLQNLTHGSLKKEETSITVSVRYFVHFISAIVLVFTK
jgi:hypothetical protein